MRAVLRAILSSLELLYDLRFVRRRERRRLVAARRVVDAVEGVLGQVVPGRYPAEHALATKVLLLEGLAHRLVGAQRQKANAAKAVHNAVCTWVVLFLNYEQLDLILLHELLVIMPSVELVSVVDGELVAVALAGHGSQHQRENTSGANMPLWAVKRLR